MLRGGRYIDTNLSHNLCSRLHCFFKNLTGTVRVMVSVMSSQAACWRTKIYSAFADTSGVRRNFSWRGFIQRHRAVICIWCALFVTSQNDVIVLFPNQGFGEVCWHNMHIFLYIHSSYFMCQCTEYKLLELQVRLSEENTYTQRYDAAVRNCKKYQAAR